MFDFLRKIGGRVEGRGGSNEASWRKPDSTTISSETQLLKPPEYSVLVNELKLHEIVSRMLAIRLPVVSIGAQQNLEKSPKLVSEIAPNEDSVVAWTPLLPVPNINYEVIDNQKIEPPVTSLQAVVVADGIGGHIKGEEASRTAISAIRSKIDEAVKNYSRAYIANEPENILDILGIQAVHDGLHAGHEAVVEKNGGPGGGANKKSEEIMGTAATAVLIHESKQDRRKAYIAYGGDVRVYKINGQGILQEVSLDDNTYISGIGEESVVSLSADQKQKLAKLSGIHENINDVGVDAQIFLLKRQIQKLVSMVRTMPHLEEMQAYLGADGSPSAHLYQAFIRRNRVSQFLGMVDTIDKQKPPLTVSTHITTLEKNEEILVISDGVFDVLTFFEIQATVRFARENGVPVAPLLIETARIKALDATHSRAKQDDKSVYYSGTTTVNTREILQPNSQTPERINKITMPGDAVRITRKSGKVEYNWYVDSISDEMIVVRQHGTNYTKDVPYEQLPLLVANKLNIERLLSDAIKSTNEVVDKRSSAEAIKAQIAELGAIRSYNNVYPAQYLLNMIDLYLGLPTEQNLNNIPRAFGLRGSILKIQPVIYPNR